MVASQRFQKEFRLNQSKVIRSLFSAPKFFQEKNFWIRAQDHSGGYPRLAIVVSKKAVPLSVRRNYFKRIIRESFRRNSNELPPWDFLLCWAKAENTAGEKFSLQRLQRAWDSLKALG